MGRKIAPFAPDAPNADLFNTLARQVQDGKTADALQTIKRLQETQIKDLQQARNNHAQQDLSQILREVISDPWNLVMPGLLLLGIFVVKFLQDGIRLRRLLRYTLSTSKDEEEIEALLARVREQTSLAKTARPEKDVETGGSAAA